MPLPAVSDLTTRWFDRLPRRHRDADEAQEAAGYAPGYPLLRYLSLLGDQADEAEALADQFVDGTVADPALIPAAGLPWLAQAVGVDFGDVTDVAERRVLLADADDLRATGSEAGLAAAVAPLLTGTRTVTVAAHYGDVWTVGIITLADETAGTTSAAIVAAASDPAVKPAGVVIVHDTGLSWADLEAGYPTWTAIEAAGSWDDLVPL